MVENRKNKHHLRKLLILIICLLAVLAAVFAVYVNTGTYAAQPEAIICIEQPENGITVTGEEGQNLIFTPEGDIQAGLIFYPGGKVDYRAYAPLMTRLAENGVLCVLMHMPCQLAILDTGAANGIQAQFPEVIRWYIGGHSLGGVSAAMYLQKHSDEYAGLILLGAYSSVDLSDTGLSVLAVYGENDGVMSRTKYEEDLVNLPADITETVIPGGCHSYFGDYGLQKGDGTPTITPEEQQEQTVDAILSLISE